MQRRYSARAAGFEPRSYEERGLRVVVGGELRPRPCLQERADPLDEAGVVDREPPLRQRVGLARMGAVERLVRGVRRDARMAREHVVPDHVHVGVTGVERLRRPAAAGVEAGDGVPDHGQRRRGVDGQLAVDRRLAEPAQLRVDLTAVEDQVGAPERLPVRSRRMRRPLRAAVEPRRRVEVPRVVHLGHHPYVELTAVGGDRLVERHQIRVAAAGRDPGRRHHLGAGAATVGADVDHRDRLQPGEELGEGRSPGAALPPAEKELSHLGVLARLALEAIGLARDPQERLVDGIAPALGGGNTDDEGEHKHEER